MASRYIYKPLDARAGGRPRHTRHWPVLGGLGLLAGAGLAGWLWWPGAVPTSLAAPGPGPAAAGHAALPTVPPAGPSTGAPRPSAPGQPPLAPEAAPPPGMSAEQWQALQASLADHPQREAELARITTLMGFRHDVARLRALRREGHATPEWQALAQRVQAGLPARLAAREISAAEALALQAAVLEVLQPDAGRRAEQLTQWRASQAAAQPANAPDARELAFQRGQTALLAAWQAEPAAQRDPAQLQARIEALRHSLFEAPAAR